MVSSSSFISVFVFFGSAFISSAGGIFVDTVSTVNRKDQMLLVLFTKVFDDSEKYFEKVRPNFP